MFILPKLQDVLAYQHPAVIVSHKRNHPQVAELAQDLFHEMLQFLWLSRKHALELEQKPNDESVKFMFVMHEEMRDIDNMWHSFLLYTKDYTEFCEKFFGEYLHHQPDVADTSPQSPQEFEADLEKFLSYVYDNLGESVVRKWFAMHLLEEAG